jgi:hypothetical protein
MTKIEAIETAQREADRWGKPIFILKRMCEDVYNFAHFSELPHVINTAEEAQKPWILLELVKPNANRHNV